MSSHSCTHKDLLTKLHEQFGLPLDMLAAAMGVQHLTLERHSKSTIPPDHFTKQLEALLSAFHHVSNKALESQLFNVVPRDIVGDLYLANLEKMYRGFAESHKELLSQLRLTVVSGFPIPEWECSRISDLHFTAISRGLKFNGYFLPTDSVRNVVERSLRNEPHRFRDDLLQVAPIDRYFDILGKFISVCGKVGEDNITKNLYLAIIRNNHISPFEKIIVLEKRVGDQYRIVSAQRETLITPLPLQDNIFPHAYWIEALYSSRSAWTISPVAKAIIDIIRGDTCSHIDII